MADTVMVPNEGELDVLTEYLAAKGADLKIVLFSNNLTVANTNVYADITKATFSGYADQTPGFGAAATVANVATAAGTQRTFTRDATGAPQTIYGAALVRESAGPVNKLLKVQKFESSQTVTNNGDLIKFTERFTADNDA